MVDVREGELGRTVWMALYLALVLVAYYILKPVSRAVFLNHMPLDSLPWLYILIAVAGGIIAYWYTRAAVMASLKAAVRWTMIITIASLLVIWWVLPYGFSWMYYVFNVWVSLFGIIMVSQGWLIAANVFDSREAKRLYGILAAGSILGAATGGTFTAIAVRAFGTNNLLLVSAALILLIYGVYRMILAQKGVRLEEAKAVEDEEVSFSFLDLLGPIHRVRHLQVIVGIIGLTYLVDQLVEYQFNVAASQAYNGDDLTAFLGGFMGIYLNAVSIVFQVFVTAAVIRAFGVAGTLQIMPAVMTILSLGVLFSPGLWTAGIARLSEAALRYSINRTGMELLYLPLPAELKNRTKVFVDIFVDRAARGVAGVILLLLGWLWEANLPQVAVTAVFFSLCWLALSIAARKEYMLTVRNRLKARRLDLTAARVDADDPAVLRQLEEAALAPNPRQAAWALGVLRTAPTYRPETILPQLIASDFPEVRVQAFDMARERGIGGFLEQAAAEFSQDPSAVTTPSALKSAACYVYATDPEWRRYASQWRDHSSPVAARAALEGLAEKGEDTAEIIDPQWLREAASDPNPDRRAVAALAIAVRGDQGIETLYQLLRDPVPSVAAAACEAAGKTGNRAYADLVMACLRSTRTRGSAIEALAAYGQRIEDLLRRVVLDPDAPENIRRQIPRVLVKIGGQSSVNLLLDVLATEQNPLVHYAALKGLNKLRDRQPSLDFGSETVTKQILAEARRYYELYVALEPLREGYSQEPPPATGLLIRSIEERLSQTLERLFRMLGLQYPPREIHTAYQAYQRGKREQIIAATDFLESVLDRDIKRAIIPILEDRVRMLDNALLLFDLSPRPAAAVLRELIRSQDPWLSLCAMAAAAELEVREAVPDLKRHIESDFAVPSQVAQWALARLA